MGLFGRDKVNDPYNTMGTSKPAKAIKALKAVTCRCPDCDGHGMRAYEHPARWARCSRCGGAGKITVRES